MTSDYFYAHQNQYDRNVGIQFNSTNWQGATYVPLQSRDTGSTALSQYNTPHARRRAWAGSHIYTTQVYEKWPGDVESFSQVIRRESTAQNFNLQLDFDNGGPFTGERARHPRNGEQDVHRDRHQHLRFRRLPVGRPQQLHCPAGPSSIPLNWAGTAYSTPTAFPRIRCPSSRISAGRNLTISMPPSLASAFANPNGWTMKTLESGDDYNRNTAITALRFDGHYKFNDGFHLNFGVRNSIRSANNDGFTLVTPVYAGMGASDPNGCLVRYVGSDVILSGNATDTTPSTWCTAGNAQGSFRAGPLSSQQLSKTPPPLANNLQQYTNLLGSGINFWAVNPHALDNPDGVLEVALSRYHDTGGARNHLGRVDEGIVQLSAGRLSAVSWAACRTAVTWVCA